MPTWNDAIEDYKRAEGALRRTDRIAYMRHIRPFLEKIGYLLVECMMPDELFRKIMNHEAYIILTETVPLIRDKVGARIPKGHELFSFIQAGYFFTHAVACADPNSMESRIRKRLHSFGESLYLAYCTASEVAMHSQTMDIDVAINQSHIDYLIRTLFDYLEKLRLAALPHYLLRILHIQPLKNRHETPLKQWVAYWERMSPAIPYSLSEDLSWNPQQPDPVLEQVEFFTERYLVLLGDSGTGKTVVALYKAYQWTHLGKRVAYITGSRNQLTYLQCQTPEGFFPFKMYDVSLYLRTTSKVYDCVVIDNAHEIQMITLQLIVRHTQEQVLICSHTCATSKWNRPKDILHYFCCPNCVLATNWRLSRKQFKWARQLLHDQQGVNQMRFHADKVLELRTIHYGCPQERWSMLLQLIQQHTREKMALLFHTDQQVKDAADFLMSLGIEVEYQYSFRCLNHFKVRCNTLNFATNILKILRYDQASGLQFDTVVLPVFDHSSQAGRGQQLYIALTRASRHCYIFKQNSRRKF